MLVGKRLVIALGVMLTVVAAPLAILVMSQYMNTGATVSDALRRDARSYATEWGIGFDEAVRRLQLQDTIGELGATLEENESATFAGLWVKHGSSSNEFGAVVRFTSNGDETIQRYGHHVANGPLANMVEVRSADKTLAELKTLRKDTVTSLKPFGVAIESSINVMENKVEVYVVDRRQLDSALSNANLDIPSKVELVTVSALSQPSTEIYGGLELETPDGSVTRSCTAGFSVESSSGTRGVTTAGHCDKDVELDKIYDSNNLPYQSGEYNEGYDVQWHTAPGLTVRNLVYYGKNYPRYVYETIDTSHQALNRYVCKYGTTTGYTCGHIVSKTYQPSNNHQGCHPNEDCDFTNDWIQVHADNTRLCNLGDSGGPVMIGSHAYGTVAFCFRVATSAEDESWDIVYMPVERIEDYGLTVLID